MDASNLLKPMLARGELHTIGATTLDEYRKHIEKDAALERRFQPVYVDQPTVEETISILRGLRERYEVHHGVRITDSALVAAAVLANRYITDRFLPDKAIDLVDEAASRLRMEIDSHADRAGRARAPPHPAGDRARGAAQGEGRRLARRASQALEKELADIGERAGALKSQWEQEKGAIAALRADEVRARGAPARDRGGRAGRRLRQGGRAEVRSPGRAPEALREQEEALAQKDGGARRLLKEEVDADDIARIVGDLDGHPRDPAAGGRAGQAHPHGGPAARAGRRPGRGHRGRLATPCAAPGPG